MTILSHILGFPRIGLKRELKRVLEGYWSKTISQHELLLMGRELRLRHWKYQKDAGIDFVSVGDFAWYDHVLTTSLMLNNIPVRFINNNIRKNKNNLDIDMLFDLARGTSDPVSDKVIVASEMKKWFNTNYHYIVPEFVISQDFQISWLQLFDEVDEALSLGYKIKVVLLGPISYLWLGKMKDVGYSRLLLLPKLLLVYKEILRRLSEKGIEWVQIDEPILVLELPMEWRAVYPDAYREISGVVKVLLTTYFDSVSHQIDCIKNIPVDGLHVDLVSGNDDVNFLHDQLPNNWVLSCGVINGRNIWRSDLKFWFNKMSPLIGKRVLWVGSSCSFLHIPIDLNEEILLSSKLRGKLSFAVQKCFELKRLCNMMMCSDNICYDFSVDHNRETCVKTNNVSINDIHFTARSDYQTRVHIQKKRFCLPRFPITTIGSFPQISDIRSVRLKFKLGHLDEESYRISIKEYIKEVIVEQEKLGLDVLVHGEPERSDMVEYFGEHLDGFMVTQNGWIQSYGSRCVKPPIIFDTVVRSKPITVEWITYAQSLTSKPVKGILTGPITILCWSFPREDITREALSLEIALAIRDEVLDLEKNGIGIIQIDEPALREGLPLKMSAWGHYLSCSVRLFKLITSVVRDDVQIHTHMCYSKFDDILSSIADMDVDVLSIEFSRVDITSLDILKSFRSFNAVGPGVYDIHSPTIPSKNEIFERLIIMGRYIDLDRLWVNPDCGLKTRSWKEIRKSLFNIVSAVQKFRDVNDVRLS